MSEANNSSSRVKKRDKRPEMARYQPPSTRKFTNEPQPTTSNQSVNSSIDETDRKTDAFGDKNIKNLETDEKNNVTEMKQVEKLETSQNENQSQPLNNTPKLTHNLNSNSSSSLSHHNSTLSPGSGGLIKIDKSKLNEIDNEKKAKTEKKIFNSTSENMSRGATMAIGSQDLNTGNCKMLYDPSNPDKPIYVSIKNKPSYNAKYSVTLNGDGNTSNMEPYQQSIKNADSNLSVSNANFYRQSAVPTNSPASTSISQANNQSILKVNSIIKKMQQVEHNLKQLIEQCDMISSFQQSISNINLMRKELEKMCIECLFTHIETSTELNVDLNHWRSCYHQVIESVRKEYMNNNQIRANQPLRDQLLQYLNQLVNEGVEFYTNLIGRLETVYLKFKCEHYMDVNDYERCKILLSTNPDDRTINLDVTIRTKDAKYALMCANRCYISLGDLERYREMIFPSMPSSSANINQRDYSHARSYYLKAMCLAPKSPRAYHQLAILAIYTRRRLDACYYYFRCLEVSTPLTSVRQSLNSLFEEVRQKTDSINKMIKNAISNKEKLTLNSRPTNQKMAKNRIEKWFKPIAGSSSSNGGASLSDSDDAHSETDSDDEVWTRDGDNRDADSAISININEKKLSANELNKRFMLNYLNTVGKLFTKVGMETYPEICSNMLHELEELLKRRPCPLGRVRLMQITVINISVIDLIHKSQHQNNFEMRSQQLECSIQLSMDVFTLIVKRFNTLVKKCEFLNASNENAEDTDEWMNLLMSIKITVEWLLCNIKVWIPLPDQLSPDLGPNPNRWQTMIDLFNQANNYTNRLKQYIGARINNDLFRIRLDEEIELAGYLPLSALPRDEYEKTSTDGKNRIDLKQCGQYLNGLNYRLVEVEKARRRLEKILLFADYLCGLEKPLLKYNVANKCYNYVGANVETLTPINKHNKLNANRTTSTCSSSSAKSASIGDELPLEQLSIDDEEGDVEMSELKEKHRLLKAKLVEQQNKERNFESVIEAHKQRQIELEIRPKFIIPDTNCFIDHLNLIDRILNASYYILVVPLLVINELEKLAKSISNYNDDSIEHAEYVQRNARKSISYLNEKFEKRQRNIKAITSQGTVLETIQFRTEEICKPGTNDELILGCCLHYCRDNARDFMPTNKNDAIHLYRDVVLLTEDRHLKLKAHTRNVPVKNIIQFCKWSNLYSSKSIQKKSQKT